MKNENCTRLTQPIVDPSSNQLPFNIWKHSSEKKLHGEVIALSWRTMANSQSPPPSFLEYTKRTSSGQNEERIPDTANSFQPFQ